jgi:hypothetical protein
MSLVQGYSSDEGELYNPNDAFNLASVPATKKLRLEPESLPTAEPKKAAPDVLAEVRILVL